MDKEQIVCYYLALFNKTHMNLLNRLYSWYGKRVVIATAAVIVLLIGAGFLVNFLLNQKEEVAVLPEQVSKVTLKSISEMGSESSFRVTGTVRAVSEARLQAESSGRITDVAVSLGDSVGAGAIIARLESSAQSAALLQAQGAYEAAEASSASSEVSIEGAEDSLATSYTQGITAYKAAFISVDSIFKNDIDDLFYLNNNRAVGLRIDGQGDSSYLITERNSYAEVLSQWNTEKDSVSSSNIYARLLKTQADIKKLAALVEELSNVVSKGNTGSTEERAEKNALEAVLTGARTALNSQLVLVESASFAIENARKGVEQAEISGASNQPSLSSAQLKSALGSLRAAQSNYEKTLVRTPISGVVNALYFKEGEYASQGMPAAVIANNNALEISTSLGASDADRITVGQEVIIDEGTKGVVTAIAPAIDPISGKKEIKVGVVDDVTLTNGSIVSIEFMGNVQNENPEKTVNQVPLSALKITASGPVVFTVVDSKLVAHPVELGEIVGDTVVIKSGVTSNEIIVVDARGLKEGQEVEVAQ